MCVEKEKHNCVFCAFLRKVVIFCKKSFPLNYKLNLLRFKLFFRILSIFSDDWKIKTIKTCHVAPRVPIFSWNLIHEPNLPQDIMASRRRRQTTRPWTVRIEFHLMVNLVMVHTGAIHHRSMRNALGKGLIHCWKKFAWPVVKFERFLP